MELTADQERRVKYLSQQASVKPDKFLERAAQAALRKIFRASDWCSPKDVAIELGCSDYTVRRYVSQGLFPEACLINPRNIKIPRSAVSRFLAERTLAIAKRT